MNKKDFVKLRRLGKFYNAFDDEAYIIFYFFDYKIVDGRCGFPASSLNKIINKLEDKKISYYITPDEIIKDFKSKNEFNKYYKLGVEKFNKFIKKKSLIEKVEKLSSDELNELYGIMESYLNGK